MCYLKPCKVKSIVNNKVLMDNGIEAYCEKKVGKIKVGDKVLVYGNLIISKEANEKKPS